MGIKIEVEHWHDSDGWSRDDGFTAYVTDDQTGSSTTVHANSRNGVIAKAVAWAGLGEVVIINRRDTYTAY